MVSHAWTVSASTTAFSGATLGVNVRRGVNHNDLTATEPWKSLVNKGNHPQMAFIQGE